MIRVSTQNSSILGSRRIDILRVDSRLDSGRSIERGELARELPTRLPVCQGVQRVLSSSEPSSIDAGEFSGDDVQIPPEPVGKCANKLQVGGWAGFEG